MVDLLSPFSFLEHAERTRTSFATDFVRVRVIQIIDRLDERVHSYPRVAMEGHTLTDEIN